MGGGGAASSPSVPAGSARLPGSGSMIAHTAAEHAAIHLNNDMSLCPAAVLEWGPRVSGPERLLGAAPLAQEGAAERGGAGQEVRIVALPVGGDEPRGRVHHVLDEPRVVGVVPGA